MKKEKFIDIDGIELIKEMTSSYEWYYYNTDVRVSHRLSGPAYITYDNRNIIYEIYYMHGKWHRNDGPALVNNFTKEHEYYIEGTKIPNDLVEYNPEILIDFNLRKILL